MFPFLRVLFTEDTKPQVALGEGALIINMEAKGLRPTAGLDQGLEFSGEPQGAFQTPFFSDHRPGYFGRFPGSRADKIEAFAADPLNGLAPAGGFTIQPPG